MRTLSNNFKLGLANSWRAVYCIKISADSGDIFWLTNKKNNQGKEIILCENLGTEMFTDGTCESLSVAEWENDTNAETIITTLSPYAGLKCMRIDYGISGGTAIYINEFQLGQKYLLEFYAKSLSGTTEIIFSMGNTPGSHNQNNFIVTENYKKYSFIVSLSGSGLITPIPCWLVSQSYAAKIILFDNLTFKQIINQKVYDSSILAQRINNETISPISSVEQNLDIIEGGNVSSYSGFQINCLNQKELYKELVSKNLTNCNTSLLFGFASNSDIPVIQLSELSNRWAGKLVGLTYDAELLTIHFEDNIENRHKNIPTVLITKEGYPRAPNASIGKPLPILYGDFTNPTGGEYCVMFGKYNLCPTVCIDYTKNIFLAAEHPIHSKDTGYGYNVYYYKDGSVPSFILSVDYNNVNVPEIILNNSGYATIRIISGNIIGLVYYPLKYVSDYNTVDNPENALDLNESTFTSMLSSQVKRFEANVIDVPSGGIPVGLSLNIDYSVYLYIVLDTPLINGGTFQAGYRGQDRILKDQFLLPTGESIIFKVLIPSHFWLPPENWFDGKSNYSELTNVSFSIKSISGATPADTLKIKAIGICYFYTIESGLYEEKSLTPRSNIRNSGYIRGGNE